MVFVFLDVYLMLPSMYVFVPLQSNNPTNVTMYIYVVSKRDSILMSGQASLEFNCANVHVVIIYVMYIDI